MIRMIVDFWNKYIKKPAARKLGGKARYLGGKVLGSQGGKLVACNTRRRWARVDCARVYKCLQENR